MCERKGQLGGMNHMYTYVLFMHMCMYVCMYVCMDE